MECYSPGRDEPVPDPLPLLGSMPGVQLPPVSNPGYIPIPSLPLNQSTELLALLRKYPIMWNGSLALKNDQAAVQFHFLSGSANIGTPHLHHFYTTFTPPLHHFYTALTPLLHLVYRTFTALLPPSFTPLLQHFYSTTKAHYIAMHYEYLLKHYNFS